ncbi:hypothetical protein H5410_031604 [Solanum commersonii]|uniref:START domain-containing protein n=1 Tax=Solanum commersonii TaxID=4109 RepID=A0A9J5YIS1_SOLCO|nr:hypothetical protein H5410_031604 [Solanum commersonii]
MQGHSDMNERRESSINVVIGGSGEEEIERSSTGDTITGGASVDERGESSSKRKKPIRHYANQIQELETFFKKNSLPNKKVRLELATKLSMDINQYENKTLKQENDKLHIKHIVMKEALENSIHENYKENIDENQIKIEHDKFKDEVKRLTTQAYKLSLFNKDAVHDKMVLLNLAMDALNEIFMLYENDKPLWVSSLDEATRASGRMADTSLALVNTLMDKRQWIEMFPCIDGKTYTTDVIFTGIVSVRKVQFLRFCKKHVEGVWVILDVSVDTIQEGSQESEIENCRRLPSGCILLDMPNGYCQVNGYFAKTISALESDEVNSLFVADDLSGERGIRMLVQCMTHNFCVGVCATAHYWEIIQLANEENSKLMMSTNISDLGESTGVVLSATKTIWLPGDDSGANQVILQDTCMDATGSLLVYAIIDSQEIITAIKGGDSSCVTLFSNGITIVPDCFQDFSTTNNLMLYLGRLIMGSVVDRGDYQLSNDGEHLSGYKSFYGVGQKSKCTHLTHNS